MFNITNHLHQATGINHLAKVGVNKNQLKKKTGHGNVSSIKPYSHLDEEFHKEIIKNVKE